MIPELKRGENAPMSEQRGSFLAATESWLHAIVSLNLFV